MKKDNNLSEWYTNDLLGYLRSTCKYMSDLSLNLSDFGFGHYSDNDQMKDFRKHFKNFKTLENKLHKTKGDMIKYWDKTNHLYDEDGKKKVV